MHELPRSQQDQHADDVHVYLAMDLLKAMYSKERTGKEMTLPN